MANRDQTVGALIFLACMLAAIGYAIALFFTGPIIGWLGWSIEPKILQFWLVAVPVLIAFTAILFIGAWIGWTMATTPPPKPLEEIETETTEEEKLELTKEEKDS